MNSLTNKKRESLSTSSKQKTATKSIRRSIKILNKNSKYHSLCFKSKTSNISNKKKLNSKMSSVKESIAEVPSSNTNNFSLVKTPSVAYRSLNSNHTPFRSGTRPNNPDSARQHSKIPLRTPNLTATTPSSRLNRDLNSAKSISGSIRTNLTKTPSSSLNRPQNSTLSTKKLTIPSKTPVGTLKDRFDRDYNSAKVTSMSRQVLAPKTPTTSKISKNLTSRFNMLSNQPTYPKTNVSNIVPKTPGRKLLLPDNKKVSRTIDCAKSIKRRSIKILNQPSTSRLSFLNDMESACLLITPKVMRQLISSAATTSTNKIQESLKEFDDENFAEVKNIRKDESEDDTIKIHSIKPECLLKYLFSDKNESNNSDLIRKNNLMNQNENITEKEPIKVEIVVKIDQNENKNEFKPIQIELKNPVNKSVVVNNSSQIELKNDENKIEKNFPEPIQDQIKTLEQIDSVSSNQDIQIESNIEINQTQENSQKLSTAQKEQEINVIENEIEKISQEPIQDQIKTVEHIDSVLSNQDIQIEINQTQENSQKLSTVQNEEKIELEFEVIESETQIENIIEENNQKIDNKTKIEERIEEISNLSISLEKQAQNSSRNQFKEKENKIDQDIIQDLPENNEEEQNYFESKEISIQTEFQDEESIIKPNNENASNEQDNQIINVISKESETNKTESTDTNQVNEEKFEDIELEIQKPKTPSTRGKRGRHKKIVETKIDQNEINDVNNMIKNMEINNQEKENDENMKEEQKEQTTKSRRGRKPKKENTEIAKISDQAQDDFAPTTTQRVLTRAQRAKLTNIN